MTDDHSDTLSQLNPRQKQQSLFRILIIIFSICYLFRVFAYPKYLSTLKLSEELTALLDYEEGMLVVTSENSDQMPVGIPIGAIQPNGDEKMVTTIKQLHKSAWVKPKALEIEYHYLLVLTRR